MSLTGRLEPSQLISITSANQIRHSREEMLTARVTWVKSGPATKVRRREKKGNTKGVTSGC